MKNIISFFLFITIVATGCYKDEDNTQPPQIIVETEEVIINTSISGSVFDLEGNTISTYTILINNQVNPISSDYFLLQLEDVKKKGQTVHVFKEDKQIGIRTQLLVENDINHMEIEQHAEFENEIIEGSNQQIDLSKSLNLDFTNTKWTGDYNGQVVAEYVNIQEKNSLTPVGYTNFSDLVAIDSKGGFYLKTRDNNGEPILAQEAFPIILQTSGLDANVNSLFKFDEGEEIWVLVTEFTSGDDVEILGEGYYTFANYTPGVFIEGVVLKEDKRVAYHPIQWQLTGLSNQLSATEHGKWIALLPENESVEVNLLNACNEFLQTETVDTKNEDLQGQDLIVKDNGNYQLLDVSILDCNGNIVETPSINIRKGDFSSTYAFTEDFTNRWISVCDEFNISAINEETGLSGPELEWSSDISGSLDVLTNCNELGAGFSYIKIRNDIEIYPSFELELVGDRSILKSQDGNIKFIFKGMEKGMYNVDEVNVLINDSDFGDKGYYIKCENSPFGCGIDHFNVTHFESSGSNSGTIRATFSGNMWMQTLSPSVAGNYDVEGVIIIKN